jgi:hypothetical protein
MDHGTKRAAQAMMCCEAASPTPGATSWFLHACRKETGVAANWRQVGNGAFAAYERDQPHLAASLLNLVLGSNSMYYNCTIQKLRESIVYLITFGKDTPGKKRGQVHLTRIPFPSPP